MGRGPGLAAAAWQTREHLVRRGCRWSKIHGVSIGLRLCKDLEACGRNWLRFKSDDMVGANLHVLTCLIGDL